MKIAKKLVYVVALALCVCLLCACSAGEEEPGALERIGKAVAVKIEAADTPNENLLINDASFALLQEFSSLRIRPAEGETGAPDEAQWLYRFTYDPAEIVLGGVETVVVFGPDWLTVDGVLYEPEEGVDYADIFGWAQGKVDYVREQWG